MDKLKLAISVLPESCNIPMTAPKPRSEHLITSRLRSVRRSPTIRNLIFGLWVASSTKWSPYGMPSTLTV